jgi:hypothetical protein
MDIDQATTTAAPDNLNSSLRRTLLIDEFNRLGRTNDECWLSDIAPPECAFTCWI